MKRTFAFPTLLFPTLLLPLFGLAVTGCHSQGSALLASRPLPVALAAGPARADPVPALPLVSPEPPAGQKDKDPAGQKASTEPVLSKTDLEGLNVYERRMTWDTGDPADKGHFLAIVTTYNETRFRITSMTLQMYLYRDAPPENGGNSAVFASFPYTVAVDIPPMGQAVVQSQPLAYPVEAGKSNPAEEAKPLSGYFMTLLSARGVPVPVSPSLSALDRLYRAATTGDMDLLRATAAAQPRLVRAGADPGGSTLLMDAVAGQHPAAVGFLLDHGAPVNLRGRNGYTALMYAVTYISPDLVSLLLSRGADVTLKDPQGKTPLQEAYDMVGSDGTGTAANRIVKMLRAAQ